VIATIGGHENSAVLGRSLGLLHLLLGLLLVVNAVPPRLHAQQHCYLMRYVTDSNIPRSPQAQTAAQHRRVLVPTDSGNHLRTVSVDEGPKTRCRG
jgi:hypothetical protein